MAEEKTTSGGAPAAPAGEPAPAGKKMTKKEAVRRSLKKLGLDAKPAEIQKDVKKRFRIDMTTDHISTLKGELRKQAGKTAPAAKAAKAKPAAAPANSREGTDVALKDILTLEDLVRRIGAAHVRTLIDVMSR
jgi:hypothetical protein